MRSPEQYYYQQGWEAARNYQRLESNTYSQGFAQHNWWSKGWYEYAMEVKIPLEQRMAS